MSGVLAAVARSAGRRSLRRSRPGRRPTCPRLTRPAPVAPDPPLPSARSRRPRRSRSLVEGSLARCRPLPPRLLCLRRDRLRGLRRAGAPRGAPRASGRAARAAQLAGARRRSHGRGRLPGAAPGRAVGQTARTSMVLPVVPGRPTTFTVQARYARAPRVCAASLHARCACAPPGGCGGCASSPTARPACASAGAARRAASPRRGLPHHARRRGRRADPRARLRPQVAASAGRAHASRSPRSTPAGASARPAAR